MADYTPQFNRNATGKFNPDLNFVSLKCGTDAYLLEDEMNEMQWIQNEARANLVREMTNSGCLDIASIGNNIPGGYNVLGKTVLNSIAINSFDAIVNGYLIHVEDPSSSILNIKTGESIYDKTYRQDFVYLECWFSEVAESQYNPNGVLVNTYGGIDNSTETFLMSDPRILGESTRRIQLQWRINCASTPYYIPGQLPYPLGFTGRDGEINNNVYAQGANLMKNDTFAFRPAEHDDGLYIAGDGSGLGQTKLGSINGYVYAIPLFVIDRTINNLGYNATSNISGGIDFINNNTSDRPDGKFANIIYEDMIYDVRHQAAIGARQYDLRYSTGDLESEVATLENRMLGVENDTAGVGGKVDTVITMLQADGTIITQTDSNVKTLLTNVGTANSALTTINTNTNGVATTLNGVKTTIDSINSTVGTINTNTNGVATSLASMNTTINTINNGVSAANTTLSGINTDVTSVKTTVGTINTNVNTANTTLGTVKTTTDTIKTNVDTANTNINTINTTTTSINTITSTINTKMDNLKTSVDNISTQVANNSTLNAKIDSIKTDIINFIDSRMDTIQTGQTNANNAIAYALNKLNDIGVMVNGLETQLVSIGADPALSQQIAYGVDLQSQQILTSGGIIQGDGSVLANGTSISVPYSVANQYCTLVTASSVPEGKIGDLWIEKNSSNIRVKNTGSSAIQCDVITVNADNTKVFIGQSTFNEMTGQKIIRTMLPTDFVVIMPTQNTFGNIGEIYITLLSDGFMVYNTGAPGNKFDWVVIDTTRLTNVSVEDINLSGLSGSPKNGQYGTNFKVLLSTPIGLPAITGTLGDLSVAKSTNNITVYNTGISTSRVRCLIFKEVIQSEQQSYNFAYYDQNIYTPGNIGANVVVPYIATSDYGVVSVLYSNPATAVGDSWIVKKNNSFDFYNTGANSVSVNLMAPKKDGSKVYVESYTTTGTTAKTIAYAKNATDFVYCMATSHNGTVGDFFINNSAVTTFDVYNLGGSTSDSFDLTRIDTTKLTNSTLIDINTLAQNTTQTFTGNYGQYYEVFLSTPIITGSTAAAINTAGGIGDIWVEKFFDKFIVHYGAGATITKVQALVLKDTTPYVFPLNKQTLASNGSTGVSANVPFARYTDYTVNAYGSGTLKTGITDEWVEKADTNFVLKLAGTANTTGTSIITSSLEVDNYRVFRGESIFNGTTGKFITRTMTSTDMVFIMPIQVPSATLSVGKIYVRVETDNTGFTVYNSGTSATKFEWFVIDTTKLRNVELKTVPIKGAAGSVVAGSGWGSNYDILVGTPDTANTGMLFISQSLNTFTVWNEGATTGNVQCLVIKYS